MTKKHFWAGFAASVLAAQLWMYGHMTPVAGLALAAIVILLLVAPVVRKLNRALDRMGGIPPRDSAED